MILSRKQLLHLPVETRSGQSIGQVIDLEFDAAEQRIWRYHVSQGSVFLKNKFLISPSQVISLSEKKMVVEDGVVKNTLLSEERARASTS
ncbi:PRC-barrel domain-containing protein [Patescibacteria group bacterium]